MKTFGKTLLSIFLIIVASVLADPFLIKLANGDIKKEQPQAFSKVRWLVNLPQWDFDGKWEQHPALLEISRITGVLPEIIKPEQYDNNNLLESMIASDDLPDIITLNLADSNVNRMIRTQCVLPYDEVINRYLPEFEEEIDAEIWSRLKYTDGKLYVLPGGFIPEDRFSRKTGIGTATFNVRKDIYLQLGKPDMDTPEAFINVLKMFKENYPVIKGSSAIPTSLFGYDSTQLSIIEEAFGIRNFFEDKAGNLRIRYKNPNYLQLVFFLNELYREGLLDRYAFIKKHEQIQKDLNEGKVFAVSMNYKTLADINSGMGSQKQDSNYVAISPLKGVEDVSFSGECRLGNTVTMISKDCREIQETLKLLSFLWSPEGNLMANFGQEGKDYRVDSDEVFKLNNSSDNFRLLYYPYFNIREAGDISEDFMASTMIADKFVYDSSAYIWNMQPASDMKLWGIHQDIINIVDREFPKAIMAQSKEGAYQFYKSMLFKLDKAGVAELEAYWSQQYKENTSISIGSTSLN